MPLSKPPSLPTEMPAPPKDEGGPQSACYGRASNSGTVFHLPFFSLKLDNTFCAGSWS
jgi:hypothetical protein